MKKNKISPSHSGGSSKSFVYSFGEGKADGDGSMKALLGGKGANLAEMTRIGLPVPPGFTISTEACTYYYENKKTFPKVMPEQVLAGLRKMEKALGKKFGDFKNPLLVAVRSGARESMPGMMDTILNLGLNDQTIQGLIEISKNERFAYDCYRRFIQMYGDVVMGVQKKEGEEEEPFETVIEDLKQELFPRKRHVEDTELDAEALKLLVIRFKELVKKRTGKSFPENPMEQLHGAIGAVFKSWSNDRAVVYRQKYKIPSEWGTAVTVQAMVFGNTGEKSGSGVAFTRDPATGEKVFYGEFLINAQGEDVVAGVRTPEPVANLKKKMPKTYAELELIRQRLEKHFREMQDFEFTIEEGRLFMLQTRNGKRTGVAAVRIAVEMVKEKLISQEEAVKRVPAESLGQLLSPIFDRQSRKAAKMIARGLPAGPGAATGRIYFNAYEVEARVAQGEKVLLVRMETSPEDIRGMMASEGTLTSRGGVSSHAALVARQMGKVCVCGASTLHIDYEKGILKVGDLVFKKGDYLSIDGSTGEVFAGELKTAPSEVIQVLIEETLAPSKSPTYQNYAKLMEWADECRTMEIRTNADQPEQVQNAMAFGARGIGLCRTEHMFFEGDRIDLMREMILVETTADRQNALDKLLPLQRGDFIEIFLALKGHPANIRLLDPPLHEFLPHTDAQQKALSKKLGISVEKIASRVQDLHEFNPMLGHRGCRLGVVFPEITEMQARAIFEAAATVTKAKVPVKPEIMIPLAGYEQEVKHQIAIIRRVADEVMKQKKINFSYMVGTMIEIPRACIVADRIAKEAEFFSFGTNDLTQTALAMSRDDAGSFLPSYQDHEIIRHNPFASVDVEGVGELMKMAIDKGRQARPKIKLGVCGEHGGDPDSIRFFQKIGLDYVSCSPFRIPVARLAAAQACL